MVRSMLLTALVATPLISLPVYAGGGEAPPAKQEQPLTKKQKVLKLMHRMFGCCVPLLDVAGDVIPGEAGRVIGAAGDILEHVGDAIAEANPEIREEEKEPKKKFFARQKDRFKEWRAHRKQKKEDAREARVREARLAHFAAKSPRDEDDTFGRQR